MSSLQISLAHQINPANACQAALALAEAGLLREIITPIAYNPEQPIWSCLNLLPGKIKTQITDELSRRTWIAPNGVEIKTYPWQEIIRIFLSRTKLAPYLGFSYKQLVEWVYTCLDTKIARHHLKDVDAIYSYEDLAATTFQAAKNQGIFCLYELPIPHYQTTRRVMLEEAELFPEIAAGIDSVDEPAWKLGRKDVEVELADHIFVASSFTKNSLLEIGVAPEKISVIPYGAPIEYFQPQPKIDDCFRATYVGRVSPRKGIHYLLQAWQQLKLKEAELLLIGSNMYPSGWLEQYEDIYHHIDSIPHPLLNQYYSQSSVFVFPSLVEGFGLVILEAMACGIPAIATPHTGGFDIITDGVDGFIVPIRDVEALKDRLEWCYSHPQELAAIGQAARRKAEQMHWGLYRQQLADRVKELLTLPKN
jgi:glycosyltransferase involved in cell wall biosynthesis